MVEYNCICCSYKTDRKLNYTRHMSSKLHLKSEKGLETQSEDKKLFEANQIIKKLTEDNANLLNTIKRLNSLVDKNHKEEDTKPNPVSKICDNFAKGFINTGNEVKFMEQDNKLDDIVSMNYNNITNNIPIFKVYMKCLVDNNLDPFKSFIKKSFKPNDYKKEDDEYIFYNDEGAEVDITCFGITRKQFSKQIIKCDELYKEYLNKLRRRDQEEYNLMMESLNNDVNFDIFSQILTGNKKAISKSFFIECLES